MSFNELKHSIIPGLQFEKPNVQSSILKINQEGFYYSIGQNGNSKKVTYDVLEKFITNLNSQIHLARNGLIQHFLQSQNQHRVISQQSVGYSNTSESLPIKNLLILKRKCKHVPHHRLCSC